MTLPTIVAIAIPTTIIGLIIYAAIIVSMTRANVQLPIEPNLIAEIEDCKVYRLVYGGRSNYILKCSNGVSISR